MLKMFFIHNLIIDIISCSAIRFDEVRVQIERFRSFRVLVFVMVCLCIYISTKTSLASRKCISLTNYFFLTIFIAIYLCSSAAHVDAVASLGTLITHLIFTNTVFALWTYSQRAKTNLNFIGSFRHIFAFHFVLLTLISVLVEKYTTQMVSYSFVFTLLGLAMTSGLTEFIKRKLVLKKSHSILLSQRMYLMPLFLLVNIDKVLKI